MAGWGGARVPRNPAAVSGPGSLSQRTDGGQPISDLPNAEYGAQAEFRELQSSAPLPQGGAVARPSGGGGSPVPVSLTGMGAPSQMGDVPVTDGAQYGVGAGVDALGLPGEDPTSRKRADIQAMHPGLRESLLVAANRGDATPEFKRMVRTVLAYQ